MRGGEKCGTLREETLCAQEELMEPTYYTVTGINGDYAYLISDTGVDNQVAMFLLPEGTDVGSRLLFADFAWTLVS